MGYTLSSSRLVLCVAWGCFSVVALTQSRAFAQSAASLPSSLVAVVDLPKVFEEHPTFKTGLEAIQQQLKQIEKDFEAKQTELSGRTKQLSELSPTSPEYKRIESEMARQIADLQVQARQAKKDYLQREAQQYYTVYNQIIAAVSRVAERHNIGLVLRYDSGAIDSSNPQAVAQGINRSVVLQRNLDITQLVVSELVAVADNTPNRAPRR